MMISTGERENNVYGCVPYCTNNFGKFTNESRIDRLAKTTPRSPLVL